MTDATLIAVVDLLDVCLAFAMSFSDYRVVKEHVIEASVWQYLIPVLMAKTISSN